MEYIICFQLQRICSLSVSAHSIALAFDVDALAFDVDAFAFKSKICFARLNTKRNPTSRDGHPRNRWALGGLRRATEAVANAAGVDARAAPDSALEAAPVGGGGGGEETACFEVYP